MLHLFCLIQDILFSFHFWTVLFTSPGGRALPVNYWKCHICFVWSHTFSILFISELFCLFHHVEGHYLLITKNVTFVLSGSIHSLFSSFLNCCVYFTCCKGISRSGHKVSYIAFFMKEEWKIVCHVAVCFIEKASVDR